MSNTYVTSTWIFTRGLGLIYFTAFLSLVREARGLWGVRGVLPIQGYLDSVGASLGPEKFWRLPTLFWFGSGDGWLLGAVLVGMGAAALAFAGVATWWMLLVCLATYFSFVTAGQEFLSFQWDILLLEVGTLALFAVPPSGVFSFWTVTEPHWLVRAAFAGLVFKLMFLSGVVKILSGDPAWRDLTALSYHYWTQPLPNPVAPFAHALPMWMHRVATAGTFIGELGLPVLIVWPRAQPFAAFGFIALSLFIAATGNYTFFNLLTIVLSLWLVPDQWWFDLWSKIGLRAGAVAGGSPPLIFAMGVLLAANLYWCTRYWLPDVLNRRLAPAARVLQSYYISNSYGLFATMTKTRPEIVIEGSTDGETWREYEFKFKPGSSTRRPPFIAPLQPRLDWQMWFAALGRFEHNPFVANLMARLFEGSPEVLGFFADNPFASAPPRYLRAQLYEYEFTAPSEIWSHGRWWTRRPLGPYSPTFRRDP